MKGCFCKGMIGRRGWEKCQANNVELAFMKKGVRKIMIKREGGSVSDRKKSSDLVCISDKRSEWLTFNLLHNNENILTNCSY